MTCKARWILFRKHLFSNSRWLLWLPLPIIILLGLLEWISISSSILAAEFFALQFWIARYFSKDVAITTLSHESSDNNWIQANNNQHWENHDNNYLTNSNYDTFQNNNRFNYSTGNNAISNEINHENRMTVYFNYETGSVQTYPSSYSYPIGKF